MYDKSVSEYFIPKSAGRLTAEDLSAAAAVYDGLICTRACRISRIMFTVTTLIAADVTAPKVEVNRRPTIDSGTGEVKIADITIPDTTAVGKTVYKDNFRPVEFAPGEELSFEHVVQAADGAAAAGAGYYSFELEDSPEEAANETNMVESA